MLRSVGAIIFGIISDRYGRKWPLVAAILMFSVVEMASGFVQTFEQFIAVRCLFGIFMGGVVGNASTTAMEDAPLEARGLLSGLFLSNYAFGYLGATCLNFAFQNTTHGWRSVFWFTAGPSVLIALFRALLPETDSFLHAQKLRREEMGTDSATQAFTKEIKPAFKEYWLLMIYLTVFCSITNFMSHGSLDLYPTFLGAQLGFSQIQITRTMVTANIGQILGSWVVGYLSNIFGRRTTIIFHAFVGGGLIAPFILVRNSGIMASAFWEFWYPPSTRLKC
jgi:MFS transporter, SHS family, lactate transporter